MSVFCYSAARTKSLHDFISDTDSPGPRFAGDAEAFLEVRLIRIFKELLKRWNSTVTLLSHFSSRRAEIRETAKNRRGGAEPETVQEAEKRRDKTEAMAESATRMVLTALSYVSTAVRRFAEQLAEGAEEEKSTSGPNRKRRKGTGKRRSHG